jgi:type I restriction enzyme S subunit
MIHSAYDEYVETGLVWLPEIPKEWELISLRRGIDFLTDFEANGSFADVKKNVELDTDDKYAWYLRATDLQNNRTGMGDEVRTCDKKAYDYLAKTRLYGGEFLVAKRGEIGKIYVVPELPCKATLAPNLYLIRLNEKLNSKFTYYWYSSSYGKPELFLADKSTTIGALYKDDVRACKILLPSLLEQQKIANFLDHETAKIDTLIDKQQQLIALLKEKRQAVISHAVTKGLNPHAPMRDSEVEWLGGVPAHWVVAQLKFNTLEMQTGPFGSQLHAEDYVIDGIPLINPAHMTAGKILPDSKVTVDKETQIRLSRHKLSAGEIIFARRGELGRCAIVTNEQEGWLCGTGSLKAKLNGRLIPEYAYLLITSDGVISELSLESKGSTMDNLNTETLGRVRMPVPPTGEQNEILNYVESIAGKYESLISKAESAISLIRERRTALISAAVTGKIDVRNCGRLPSV